MLTPKAFFKMEEAHLLKSVRVGGSQFQRIQLCVLLVSPFDKSAIFRLLRLPFTALNNLCKQKFFSNQFWGCLTVSWGVRLMKLSILNAHPSFMASSGTIVTSLASLTRDKMLTYLPYSLYFLIPLKSATWSFVLHLLTKFFWSLDASLRMWRTHTILSCSRLSFSSCFCSSLPNQIRWC